MKKNRRKHTLCKYEGGKHVAQFNRATHICIYRKNGIFYYIKVLAVSEKSLSVAYEKVI